MPCEGAVLPGSAWALLVPDIEPLEVEGRICFSYGDMNLLANGQERQRVVEQQSYAPQGGQV